MHLNQWRISTLLYKIDTVHHSRRLKIIIYPFPKLKGLLLFTVVKEVRREFGCGMRAALLCLPVLWFLLEAIKCSKSGVRYICFWDSHSFRRASRVRSAPRTTWFEKGSIAFGQSLRRKNTCSALMYSLFLLDTLKRSMRVQYTFAYLLVAFAVLLAANMLKSVASIVRPTPMSAPQLLLSPRQ